MLLAHIKMAIRTIRGARVRSILTMLGIIIGVSSVTLTVALAQGIKSNTEAQLDKLGSTFVTIQPGAPNERSDLRRLKDLNVSNLLRPVASISTLSSKDAETVAQTPNIATSAPVMLFTGSVVNGDKQLEGETIIATSPEFPLVLSKQIESGAFFGPTEIEKPFVILGNQAAHTLFGEDTPLGSEVTVRGQAFTVLGVMQAEKASNVRIGPAFDNAVFVTIPRGKDLNGGDVRFQFIYATARSAQATPTAAEAIEKSLKANHGGESDFMVLTRDKAVAASDQETRLVSTAAVLLMSVSLLVAGVGIMNIMLMLVTERTREIGIRKALGATNRQIANQFLTEALVLSVLGGMVGLLVSVAVVSAVDAYTDVKMTLTLPMIALGLGVPVVIGGIFGFLPAMRAARKDPIKALRNE